MNRVASTGPHGLPWKIAVADHLELFNASYERIHDAQFFERFYERFLEKSEEVAKKFANTDLRRQRRMLRGSMLLLLSVYMRHRSEELEQLALKHGPAELAIPPALFDDWLEALIETVEECDPRADKETQSAWRVVFAPGVAFMKSRAVPPPATPPAS